MGEKGEFVHELNNYMGSAPMPIKRSSQVFFLHSEEIHPNMSFASMEAPMHAEDSLD
jgi:hypothetical protein